MAMDNRMYNSHGKKYAVPRERVYSIFELERGDHIALHRKAGLYWHHAIVEFIDYEKNEINVIHYIKSSKGLRVITGRYKFDKEVVYLMKHERCLDPETVVRNARRMIGDDNYNLFTNNCEHFAMWCKTGISSSDQIDKAEEMIVSNELKQTASQAGQGLVERGAREGANRAFMGTAARTGHWVAQRGARVAASEALTRSASRAGQEFVQRGVHVAANQALTRSASRAGQEFVQRGVRVATNQALARSASRAGQQFVQRGVHVATNQALTRGACASHTGTAAGIGALESVAGGALIGAGIEFVSGAYDIGCAHDDMVRGRITPREFDTVVGNRIVTGTTNVGGAVTGMAIGQALIPVPVLGGLIGGTVGALAGSLIGNTLVNL